MLWKSGRKSNPISNAFFVCVFQEKSVWGRRRGGWGGGRWQLLLFSKFQQSNCLILITADYNHHQEKSRQKMSQVPKGIVSQVRRNTERILVQAIWNVDFVETKMVAPRCSHPASLQNFLAAQYTMVWPINVILWRIEVTTKSEVTPKSIF